MKLSMKSRYGLRALIDLSVNSKNEQVALGGIYTAIRAAGLANKFTNSWLVSF